MVVTIDFNDLVNPEVNLSQQMEEAYGPEALGILFVKNVPGFVDARQRMLPCAAKLAELPEADLKSMEDPKSSYAFGWSHGKEILQDGKADTLKGSFYANPLHDTVSKDEAIQKQHPSYARDNIWPKTQVPDLEFAFKDLGSMIIQVGEKIAKRCDEYILEKTGSKEAACCAEVIAKSPCPKGRLLHYFPADSVKDGGDQTNWCGWHNDHGSLTGLTRAMFLKKVDGKFQEVANPDPEAGLYIRNRADEIVRAVIPADCIAYQMGECLQILSGGLLNATPHYVKGASPKLEASHGVSRNTLAIFMQPHWDDVLKIPDGFDADKVKKVEAWENGVTFGSFTNTKLGAYYEQDELKEEVAAAGNV